MTYQEKCELFAKRDGRDIFRTKTSLPDLPIEIKYGSSSHHPERKGGITTCDLVLWVKAINDKWFRPFGHFDQAQIEAMIDICHNDQQFIALMSLLSYRQQ